MSIAYLDPGNIESDLQSGAKAGFKVHNLGYITNHALLFKKQNQFWNIAKPSEGVSYFGVPLSIRTILLDYSSLSPLSDEESFLWKLLLLIVICKTTCWCNALLKANFGSCQLNFFADYPFTGGNPGLNPHRLSRSKSNQHEILCSYSNCSNTSQNKLAEQVKSK